MAMASVFLLLPSPLGGRPEPANRSAAGVLAAGEAAAAASAGEKGVFMGAETLLMTWFDREEIR